VDGSMIGIGLEEVNNVDACYQIQPST